MNPDRAGKGGQHWWSFLEVSSKEQIFCFDSYGFIGLKVFIIDNDRKVIGRFFHGLSKMNKKDSKINLTYIEFVPPAYEKIDKNQLATTAQDFFHTLDEFSKMHKLKKVNIYMVDDCLQHLETDTCGIFQLYFYTNLFLPNIKTKIINNKKLTMKTITTLLNELFTLDVSENERRVENFAEQLNIKREKIMLRRIDICPRQHMFYTDIDFEQVSFLLWYYIMFQKQTTNLSVRIQ